MTKSTPRVLVLTKKNMLQMKHKTHLNYCHLCKEELERGDEIITKRTRNAKWYHKSCAERVNII